jgi:hypothetical protein
MTSNEIPFKEFRYGSSMEYNDSPKLYAYLKHIYDTRKIVLYYIGGSNRLAKIRNHNDELQKIKPIFKGYWCRNDHIEKNTFNDESAGYFRGLDNGAYYFVFKDHPFAVFGKTFKNFNEIVKFIQI